MSEKLPFIAVLITCFNRKQKTLECLNSLFDQIWLNDSFFIEVFLVDDGSTDGTANAVAKDFPSVNIIKGDGNLYWNRGMHKAWSTASRKNKYDFYLWLNDDITLFKNAIVELLACYKLVGESSIICGSTCSKISGNFTYGGKNQAGKPIVPDGAPRQCGVMNGNCVLISQDIFKTVGFIDPIFIHAIGDYDYGFRAQKKGYTIFTTRAYIAFCEDDTRLPKWCLQATPFKERLKSLYSPLGNSHPYYYFIYEKRHFGILTAIKHFFSIHLRVIRPSLWE